MVALGRRVGMRDPETRPRGAKTAGIVYEVSLTLELPAESAGSAMNALAHCAEALYTRGRSDEADADALAGAPLISAWLPVVVADGNDLEARRGVLGAAMHAGAAPPAEVGVGHAIAQALGGRYGFSHGAMNPLSLPPHRGSIARFAAGEIERFGEAIDHGDPIERVSELAALAGRRVCATATCPPAMTWRSSVAARALSATPGPSAF